jgi:hydroxyacylglutathione hydrolase
VRANSYVVETGDGLMVIDTGMPGNADKVLAFVRGLGRAPEDVRTIVLTHADIDHVGSLAPLKRATGAAIAIHAADAPALAGTGPGKKRSGAVGLLMAAMPRFFPLEHVQADVELNDGDTVGGFRVLHTPGHTPGSITLHRDGVVFSGDALLSDAEGHESPPRKAMSGDWEQAQRSADKIRALGYRVLLTGHGEPVVVDRA